MTTIGERGPCSAGGRGPTGLRRVRALNVDASGDDPAGAEGRPERRGAFTDAASAPAASTPTIQSMHRSVAGADPISRQTAGSTAWGLAAAHSRMLRDMVLFLLNSEVVRYVRGSD